jgi:hypothetical protein
MVLPACQLNNNQPSQYDIRGIHKTIYTLTLNILQTMDNIQRNCGV